MSICRIKKRAKVLQKFFEKFWEQVKKQTELEERAKRRAKKYNQKLRKGGGWLRLCNDCGYLFRIKTIHIRESERVDSRGDGYLCLVTFAKCPRKSCNGEAVIREKFARCL